MRASTSRFFFVDAYFRIGRGCCYHTCYRFVRLQGLVLEDLLILLYIDVYKRMPMTELTISEARKALLDLPEKLARTPERAVTITRRGQPVLAILPWEFYESIVETLEILGDAEMVTALRESVEDLKRGRVVSHAEVKKRLGV